MFTSARTKKNRRRPKTAATRKRSASKESMLNHEYEKLHAKIGVLEDFITASAAKQERRSQMRDRNILPPPEQWRKALTKRGNNKSAKRSPRWQQRQQAAQRERSGLAFLVLFGAACALGWWLLNSWV